MLEHNLLQLVIVKVSDRFHKKFQASLHVDLHMYRGMNLICIKCFNERLDNRHG
jgi:hypothetical protein